MKLKFQIVRQLEMWPGNRNPKALRIAACSQPAELQACVLCGSPTERALMCVDCDQEMKLGSCGF